jgi:hypothetical protein
MTDVDCALVERGIVAPVNNSSATPRVRRRTVVSFSAAAIFAVLAGLLTFAGPVGATSGGAITPTTIVAGGTATVSGDCTGSPFNDEVRVVILGPSTILIATGVASPVGVFSGTIAIPAGLAPGPYTLQSQCSTFGGSATFLADTPVIVQAAPAVTVTGVATCNAPASPQTSNVVWTVTNSGPAGTITITDATESGVASASVVLTPTSPAVGSSATGSDTAVPNVAGTLTLTVGWTVTGFTGVSTGSVAIAASCPIPVTPVVDPVVNPVVAPTFTG